MKKEKLNLKSIKKVLSRTELKTIMAGSTIGGGTGGCTPYIIPAAVFACHDSTGYVVGHATTNCCSHTAGALQACNNVTYPTVTYSVTGPC
jgi:hypothetical protein